MSFSNQRQFIKNSAKRTFSGRGLPNRGFTCYLGSALQCLYTAHEILNFLIEHCQKNQVAYDNNNDYKLLRSYIRMIETNLEESDSNKSLSISNNLIDDFFKAFFSSSFSKNEFKRYQYHDPSEFLCGFINYIDKCLIEIEIRKSNSTNEINLYEVYQKYEKRCSLLKNSFQIQIKQNRSCTMDFSHRTFTIESSLQLSVPIESCFSIEQCLESFFSTEVSDERIFCEDCEQYRYLNINYSIESLSDNIIISLNRIKVK